MTFKPAVQHPISVWGALVARGAKPLREALRLAEIVAWSDRRRSLTHGELYQESHLWLDHGVG